jgi:hypothetical protein
MSIDALNRAFAVDMKPTGGKFVLIALANLTNEANTCFPGRQLLAKQAGQSPRSPRAHLTALEGAVSSAVVNLVAQMGAGRATASNSTSKRKEIKLGKLKATRLGLQLVITAIVAQRYLSVAGK